MIGGTSKIPFVQRKLREAFNRDDLIIAFPKDDPQLMVVKGSAIIGGSLAYDPLPGTIPSPSSSSTKKPSQRKRKIKIKAEIEDIDNDDEYEEEEEYSEEERKEKFDATSRIVVEDVIPLSLGFSICTRDYDGSLECGIMDPIVRKNSQYPTQASEIYCQRDPNSSVATLSLYEGENRKTKDNYFLGFLNISQIPPRVEERCDSILVHFIIDKNGIATIEATINTNNSNSNNNNGSIHFNTSLPVATDDGMFSKSESIKMSKEMISWFDNKEIKTMLENLVQQSNARPNM